MPRILGRFLQSENEVPVSLDPPKYLKVGNKTSRSVCWSLEASYVSVVQAEVLAGAGEAEVRRAAARVHHGQRHRQQAPPQQAALLVQGRQLPRRHGLCCLGEITRGSVYLCGDLSFQFIPAVLKPDLDLRLRELQRAGEAGAFRAAQVPLHVEGRLQLEDLSLGKDGARFLFRDDFAPFAGAASLERLRRRAAGDAVVAAAVPALIARARPLDTRFRVCAAGSDRH